MWCQETKTCFWFVGTHQQSIPQLLSLASQVYKGKVERSSGFELQGFAQAQRLWFWTNEIHPHKALPVPSQNPNSECFTVADLGFWLGGFRCPEHFRLHSCARTRPAMHAHKRTKRGNPQVPPLPLLMAYSKQICEIPQCFLCGFT